MRDHIIMPVIAQGANDIFIHLGFCPDVVRLTEWATGLEVIWHRYQGIDVSITIVAAGDKTVQTGEGIKLCALKTPLNSQYSSDPTPFSDANPVEGGEQANGIVLTSDLAGLTDHALLVLEAWRMTIPVVRGVHDGTTSSNTYFEDSSVDFLENGVCGGQQWLIYNMTNNNYAYVKDVQKPSTKTKYCRLTTSDSGGNATAAADFDTSDVALVIPSRYAQYPLSDYGIMT